MKKLIRRWRGALLGALARALSRRLGRRDYRGAQRFGKRLGKALWHLSRRDRERALAHLGVAFPELDPPQREALARASLVHHGVSLAECLYFLHQDCEEVARRVAIEGREHLEAARREDRATFILTAHCGNWELLGAAVNCAIAPLASFGRPPDEPELAAILAELRTRFGGTSLGRGETGSARKLLAVLRGGGLLAMLIDQDTRVEGTWVPFFGRPAYTPVAPAKLTAKHGLAVVPAFMERLEDGSHVLRFAPRPSSFLATCERPPLV